MASCAVPSTTNIPQTRRKRNVDPPSGLPAPQAMLGDAPLLLALLRSDGLPLPLAEYPFGRELTPSRRWRFDYAYPEPHLRIALEIEGAIWQQGRHTRGGGYRGDIEKYNAAALAGWLVLRCTYDMLQNGQAIDYLRAAFALRASQTASQTSRDASSTSSCVNASVTSSVPQLTQTSVTGDSYGRPLERATLTTPAADSTNRINNDGEGDGDGDGRCGRRERQRERRRERRWNTPARAGL